MLLFLSCRNRLAIIMTEITERFRALIGPSPYSSAVSTPSNHTEDNAENHSSTRPENEKRIGSILFGLSRGTRTSTTSPSSTSASSERPLKHLAEELTACLRESSGLALAIERHHQNSILSRFSLSATDGDGRQSTDEEVEQRHAMEFQSVAESCRRLLEEMGRRLHPSSTCSLSAFAFLKTKQANQSKQTDGSRLSLGEQARSHWGCVAELLTARYKLVCKRYSDTVAFTVRRMMCARQYGRLTKDPLTQMARKWDSSTAGAASRADAQGGSGSSKQTSASTSLNRPDRTRDSRVGSVNSQPSTRNKPITKNELPLANNSLHSVHPNGASSLTHSASTETPSQSESQRQNPVPSSRSPWLSEWSEWSQQSSSQTVSASEAEEFRQEQSTLLRSLSTERTELCRVETQLLQIGQLQQVFSEEVLRQAGVAEDVFAAVVKSGENVSAGNRSVRAAMGSAASMRVWMLFSLLVLAFTLLFLDWYNP